MNYYLGSPSKGRERVKITNTKLKQIKFRDSVQDKGIKEPQIQEILLIETIG